MHKASVWEVTHHKENNAYIIKTEKSGKTYHLCAHDFYPNDKRDQASKYAAAHTMAHTENAHWHIKSRGGEHLISVAGNSFNLHGWHLWFQLLLDYSFLVVKDFIIFSKFIHNKCNVVTML